MMAYAREQVAKFLGDKALAAEMEGDHSKVDGASPASGGGEKGSSRQSTDDPTEVEGEADHTAGEDPEEVARRLSHEVKGIQR